MYTGYNAQQAMQDARVRELTEHTQTVAAAARNRTGVPPDARIQSLD